VSETKPSIRRATTADANDIAHIHVDAPRAAYRGIYSDEYLDSLSYTDRAARWLDKNSSLMSADPNIAVFVAHDGDKILGFADVGISRDPIFNNHAETYAIYLVPDLIGQGIGAALFHRCTEHAKQHGFNKMIVRVLSKNNLARQFYERMGGVVIPISEKKISTGGVEENVIHYEWSNLAQCHIQPSSSLKREKKDSSDKKSPQRKCLVSGESFDKSELLRFVRAPDGTVTFDVSGKLPGRGAYLTISADALKTALKKNLFAKSFKENTRVPPDMAQQVVQQLRAAALQYLALARRAGDAVAGAEKCKDFATRHRMAAVILADDAGDDTRSLARRLGEIELYPITHFNRDELGAIFGREQAVIIALRTGGVARQFLMSSRKLAELAPLGA